MKILCIGHASYDFYFPVSKYPEENYKYRIDNQVECGGGASATASILLSKWGTKTFYQGVLGNDLFGKKLMDEFKSFGVNTKYVEKTDEASTTLSFIIINQQNGSRTLFNYLEKPIEIKNFEYDFTPNIILSDGYNYNATFKAIKKFPKATFVIDAGRANEETLDLCNKADYIVGSKEFAEEATMLKINYEDNRSLTIMYENLEKKFNKKLVITLEEKGCLYRDDQGTIKVMTGLKVLPKDTTGAGDIFHGAFVYGLSKGLLLETCLKIANIAAGLSVKSIGTRNSIPSLEEVHTIYEKNN